MNLDTVIIGWLEPGTVLKSSSSGRPRGRLYLGAKGIGRFAAARLAPPFTWKPAEEDESEGVTVLLHWGTFGDQSYLDEIALEYHVTRLCQTFPTVRSWSSPICTHGNTGWKTTFDLSIIACPDWFRLSDPAG